MVNIAIFKIEVWLRTITFILLFVAILIIFHPLLLAAKFFLPKSWRKVLNVMNYFLLLNIKCISGSKIFVKKADLPFQDVVRIYVANHQSMFDIPLIMNTTYEGEKLNFVAKKELGRFLPSISFALRSMKAALIKRDNLRQSLSEIVRVAKFIKLDYPNTNSICIFPEGTRARDGVVKPFIIAGLKKLILELQSSSSAESSAKLEIVPVSIAGSWCLLKDNFWPICCFTDIKISYGEPYRLNSRKEYSPELLHKIELEIKQNQLQLEETSKQNKQPPLFFLLLIILIFSLFL
jgi:1-acyl-sn-glycerol-3-phosphate acyltransferase